MLAAEFNRSTQMAEFSAGTAITSGFRLIGERPLAVLAWGFAYLIIAVLPQFLVMWHMLPDIMAVYRDALQSAQAGGPPPADSPDMVRVQAELVRYQPMQIALTVIGLTIVNSAIYRAVLEPERKAFGYLRLSVQELWVGLATIVFYVLVMLAFMGAMIPVGVAAVASSQAASWGNGLLVFLMACGAAAVLIWVCLRLSLALPMSFDQRGFRLFESWKLTRGQGWKLFGVLLALVCIVIAIELALMVVAAVIVGATGAGQPGQLQAFFSRPPAEAMSAAIPWVIAVGVFYTVLMGAMFAIMTAPFAEIYRELAKPEAAKVF